MIVISFGSLSNLVENKFSIERENLFVLVILYYIINSCWWRCQEEERFWGIYCRWNCLVFISWYYYFSKNRSHKKNSWVFLNLLRNYSRENPLYSEERYHGSYYWNNCCFYLPINLKIHNLKKRHLANYQRELPQG